MNRHERRGSSPLQIYLHDLEATPLLEAQQERELAGRIAAGDPAARDHLARANLRLVVALARGYLGRGLSLEDLVAEGNLGLMQAVAKFDPVHGTRFSTYAACWIKQAICHALTNTAATIRLPAYMVHLLRQWRRAERRLARDLGSAPGPERVAAELGLTALQRELVARALCTRHLRGQRGCPDEDPWSAEEVPAGVEAPEARVEAEDLRRDLRRRLGRLDDRERAVLTLRFGLDGEDPLSPRQIGQRLGVTREWVHKLELRAVRKLDDAEVPCGLRPRRAARTLQPA